MSYKPLAYFTLFSTVAHSALFGLWPATEQEVSLRQESMIEIGLVMLPKVDQSFSTEKSRPQQRQSARKATPEPPPLPAPEQHRHTRQPAQNITPTAMETISTPTEAVQKLPAPPTASKPVAPSTPSPVAKSSSAIAVDAAPIMASNPAPTYPADALRYGWEGEVWLKVDVNRNGDVSDISIDKSSGYPVLDQAAAGTVRKWQFAPARVGSETVDGTIRVPVRFKIRRT